MKEPSWRGGGSQVESSGPTTDALPSYLGPHLSSQGSGSRWVWRVEPDFPSSRTRNTNSVPTATQVPVYGTQVSLLCVCTTSGALLCP